MHWLLLASAQRPQVPSEPQDTVPETRVLASKAGLALKLVTC
jgi:hypothetical protein